MDEPFVFTARSCPGSPDSSLSLGPSSLNSLGDGITAWNSVFQIVLSRALGDVTQLLVFQRIVPRIQFKK